MRTYYNIITIIFFSVFSTTLVGQDDQVFKIVEKMPTYGECNNIADKKEKKTCSDKAIITFMTTNISYPEVAIQNNTQGTVVIQFIVNEDGTVSDPKVLKDIGDGCGEEAVKVLKTMGLWNPGMKNGQPVKVQMAIPVRFKHIPIYVKTEKFSSLSDLFCLNYSGEFLASQKLIEMAEDQFDKNDVCVDTGLKASMKKIKMTITHNDLDTTFESTDGNFSENMRNALRNVKEKDTVAFDLSIGIMTEEGEKVVDFYKFLIAE